MSPSTVGKSLDGGGVVDFSEDGDHVLHTVSLSSSIALQLPGQRVEHVFARCTDKQMTTNYQKAFST